MNGTSEAPEGASSTGVGFSFSQARHLRREIQFAEASASAALDGQTWPVGLPQAWIFDIDGTLTEWYPQEKGGRDGRRGWFDWHRVAEDAPNESVAELVRTLHYAGGLRLLFVTGRPESCRKATVDWIEDRVRVPVPDERLFMRRPGFDDVPDPTMKRAIYRDEIAPRFEVRGVFEDLLTCIEMWAQEGLITFQVRPGRKEGE